MLSVYQLRAVLVTVPVQKDIEPKRTVHALMWMNVPKDIKHAVMALNVLINQVAMIVHAHMDMAVIHIMDTVHHHKNDVLPMPNVVQMKNVFNPVNVYARHHISWTQVTVINVRVLVNDSRVVLMQNVHQLIHHNACVRLATRVIHWKDVHMKMNV